MGQKISFFGFTMPINRAKEYHRITIRVETISLKLPKEQAKLLAAASKEQGFPSKSEFVRYAIARALEDRLSVKTIQDIFESRPQIRAGKTEPPQRLMKDEWAADVPG